ncbi:hypothetical protein AURDEDRAFT_156314 [Auricularia subglabra TFB-10046 SS5]|nr:hypothetical protein AURDEDRAFT_156314 [Auricularia subglabra TFB-10046 SS5]
MSLPALTLLRFLESYPQPAWAVLRSQLLNASASNPLDALKPCWTNPACSQLDEPGVQWQETIYNLLRRCQEAPKDPEACMASSRNWKLVATLVQDHFVITSTRRPGADAQPAARGRVNRTISRSFSGQVDPDLAALWSRTYMGRMVLDFPWQQTSLGPLHTWPETTKFIFSLILSWPERLSVWLGEDMICVYNDFYIKVLGPRKHPSALGVAYKDVWPEIWEVVQGYCFKALSGETVYHRDNLVFLDREPTGSGESWAFEETYHTWSFVPLCIGSTVVGFINESAETTARVIGERRMDTLRELILTTSLCVDRENLCVASLEALSKNPIDFPFLIMYRIQHLPARAPGDPQGNRLNMHSSVGVPSGQNFAPMTVDVLEYMSESSATSERTLQPLWDDDAWPFQEALLTKKSVLVSHLGKRAEVLERRGWDHQCHSAVVFPVSSKDGVPELLVISGLNPCRPFDDDYRGYVELLQTQLSNGLSIVMTFEAAEVKAEELASLDRAKTVFFNDVSHELRTPLTLILGPLDDIVAEPGDALLSTAQPRIKVALRHAIRLHQLVNTLLDFARLEAGRYIATFRPVDLGTVTADFASLFRSAIERGGVKYVVNCPEGTECFVDIDAWEKVVTNIISNAFKYWYAQLSLWKLFTDGLYSMEGKIEVEVRYTATSAIFSCCDTGCGIPEAELGNIFKRFHRVESIESRSIEGTGVGLALTLETVKSLGGQLDVQSEVCVGTTFTVTLPLGTAHIPTDRLSLSPVPPGKGTAKPQYGLALADEAHGWLASEASEDSRSRATSNAVDSTPRTEGERLSENVIVIADDNADLRHYCTNLLSAKYTVKAFADGQAALDYVLHNRVDLILSDVQMPRLGGYALLRSIREERDVPTSLLPFILLSATAGTQSRTEGLNAGADDYLVKPFASRELLARVKTHLEIGRRRRDLESQVAERTRELTDSQDLLRKQMNESEHMRKQQEIVVDLTSHELRNPLNAIWQNAELVEAALTRLRTRADGDEKYTGTLDEADEAVRNIVLSVAHQTRIADDILNFSKISMQLMTIHCTPFHLHDTVRDVMRMWEIETRERDIQLELTTAPSLRDAWIDTDPQRCSQILINFLTNAIRYTSDATTRKITVFLESFEHVGPPGPNVFRVAKEGQPFPDGFWLRVGVSDSGPGLTTEECQRLFERFSQAHPSKDQFSGGHGLGLFVSRHIVILLNGYIDVAAVKGEGCTFSFSIPVQRVEPQYLEGSQPWRTRLIGGVPKDDHAPQSMVRTLSGTMRPLHILVVEDNIINQKVLTRQLQSRGFHTSVANDGQEALDRILDDGGGLDLVLMDIEMPVKDGRAACRELREIEARTGKPRLPIIAVTGNAREEQIRDCLDAGFDDVAIKPYRIVQVVGAIESMNPSTNANYMTATTQPTGVTGASIAPTSGPRHAPAGAGAATGHTILSGAAGHAIGRRGERHDQNVAASAAGQPAAVTTRPSTLEKIDGSIEKGVGELTNNPAMVAQGQAKKTGGAVPDSNMSSPNTSLNTRNLGFLPIPKYLQYDPARPFTFSLALNILFGFTSTMTVCNLYYCQPLLVQFAKTFDVSQTEVAIIPTLTQAGYAAGLVFLTPLGDLVPRRPLILLLLVSSTFLSLGVALAPSLGAISTLSFLLGAATVTPQVLIPLAADLAPPHKRAGAISIVLSGLLLGILVARVLAGIIGEFTGLEGWRNVYWMAFGIQAATWLLVYALIPDWPAKNRGTGLSYFGVLKTMVVYAFTEPLLIQCYIIGFLSSAVFSNFWVTLTFLLDGPPYHYSTLQIGLFGLVGILGVCTAPFVGRAIDRFVPWFTALVAILSMMLFQAIQVGAGGISIAAVIIVIFGLDYLLLASDIAD